MERRHFLQTLLAAGLLPLISPLHAAETQGKISLGIMPFNSTLALFRTHQPLRQFIQSRLGQEVELFTATDYPAFLKDALAGRFDLLILGPHFGAMCLKKDYLPLYRYKAVLRPLFVVRQDAAIQHPADMKGKRVALSSSLSMSSIGGVRWLAAQGLHMGQDYQLFERPTHGAAIAAVAVGEMDAALTTDTALKQVPEDVRGKVRKLPLDVEIPHLMTIAHKRLGAARIEQVRQALHAFPQTPEGEAFFRDTGYEGYVPISRKDLEALQPLIALTEKLLQTPPRQ